MNMSLKWIFEQGESLRQTSFLRKYCSSIFVSLKRYIIWFISCLLDFIWSWTMCYSLVDFVQCLFFRSCWIACQIKQPNSLNMSTNIASDNRYKKSDHTRNT